MLTINSRIKDVYDHTIGHAVIQKVLLKMGYSDNMIKNPIVGNLKLKSLPKFSGGKVDESFIEKLLELINNEPDSRRALMIIEDLNFKKE